MNKLVSFKLILYILLATFAFYINYYYANKGLYPIDTFTFFDASYYITKGLHPIKDFWVMSGILVDYIQAVFFYIFGFNWNAYIFHSSFFNLIITLFFFYFLNIFNKNLFHNFLLSLSVAVLCYPVAGTPFPYQHSFILSLLSLMVFYLAVYKEEKKYWIILPFLMGFAFLSMQLPSGIINLLILIFSSLYFITVSVKNIKYFFIGFILFLIILFIYFFLTKVSLQDFLIQIIFFPLEIGQGRIHSTEGAFESAKLINKLTIRGTVGHFKFINIFLLANLILLVIYIRRKKFIKFEKKILINILIFFSACGFMFHQLITANQTFIFALVPILCGFFIIQINEFLNINVKENIKLISILLIVFVTVKYHFVFNEQRKFMDLQNVDLSSAVEAKYLDKKFNGLKWITPGHYSKNPNEELELLGQSLNIIKNDADAKMLITHYQFFSIILDDNLNIPNRWYFPNQTFPASKDIKYYKEYLKKFNQKLDENKINTIYIAETFPGEFDFINFDDLLENKCFLKEDYNKILYSIKIKKCN
ncbi:MAG: hypothetical protein CBC88_03580 [Candidatus Pelagibacter sp. TMED128]|nr:MAG: hypothetical protein CBC88_03580 [Candidatus Pelagibacter sp. TMED128]|tara:strand:+ start:2648 stop:4249 length:1602 start_codon:yes stop_codon:yes gene_type:complete